MSEDLYESEQDRLVRENELFVERYNARVENVSAAAEIQKEAQEAEKEASNRRGLILDTGQGIARAIPGAAAEFFELISELDESLGRKYGVIDIDPFDGDGIGLDKFEEGVDQSPFRYPQRGYDLVLESMAPTERFSGAVAEPIAKFVAGFMGGRKALEGAQLLQGTTTAGRFANAAAAGFAADAAVFDGHEERLSNLIQSVEALQNPVTDYLEADELDGELEGRLKAAVEGLALGGVAESILSGIRAVRALREQRAVVRAVQAAEELQVPTPAPAKVEALDSAVDEVPVAQAAEPSVNLTPEQITAARREQIESSVRSTVQLTDEQKETFEAAIAAGDEDSAMRSLQDFNEDLIDWDSFESAGDIKSVLLATEEVFADVIDEVKGGVQSNARTVALARSIGANPEEITQLLRDTRGSKGIAARVYAGQRMLMASAANLRRLANAALETNSYEDRARYMNSMQIHVALQAELKGSQTEIARALQAMSIVKKEMADGFPDFTEASRRFGGKAVTDRVFTSHLREVAAAKNMFELNARTRATTWEKARDILVEYTINSMLSSPKTHVINITSNILNTGLYTFDRFLAGAYRRMVKGEKDGFMEFKIDALSKWNGLGDAWALARQAWKDGAPVSDVRQRVEFQNRKAIQADGVFRENVPEADLTAPTRGSQIITPETELVRDADGTVLGAVDNDWFARAINTLGNTVRIPGRALIAGDEFSKAWNRNAEIKVLAYRRAAALAEERGLELGSPAYEKFVRTKTIELSLPDNRTDEALEIQIQAVEKSRRVSFQEDAQTEKLGAYSEQLVNASPILKLVIAPFFKTPMNIVRQGALDRTPLGAVFLKSIRDQITQGSPQAAQEAIARMTTGVAAFAAFYGMVAGGDDESGFEIVGKIPYDSSKKAQGVLDYSIRLGDRWYQFNRLDPLGMWLGMVADFKTHSEFAGPEDDENSLAFVQAAVGSFANNVVNKTWMQSLSRLQDTFDQVKGGKPVTVERALNRFAAGEMGKLIPQLFKSTARVVDAQSTSEDPVAREAWSFLDSLSAQLPVLNRDLPPRHDALGRPITWEAGPLSIVNPFATSRVSDSPVDQELARLAFTIRPMQKSLGSGSIQLTAEEYSKMTGLVAKSGIEETLDALVTSPTWDDMPDPLKIVLIKQQIQEARKLARGLILTDPDLNKRVGDQKIKAASLLTGTEE